MKIASIQYERLPEPGMWFDSKIDDGRENLTEWQTQHNWGAEWLVLKRHLNRLLYKR